MPGSSLIDLNTLPLPEVYRALAASGLVSRLLELARDEDLATVGDVTSECSIGPESTATGVIVARSGGVLAGLVVLPEIGRLLAPGCAVRMLVCDGDSVEPGTSAAEIRGPLREILAFERTALNILGRLSGVATRTRKFVEAVGVGARGKLYDTRKTTPGLRVLEKYAVRCGGGCCHRIGLFDAVLMKDNHIADVAPSELGEHAARAAARARRQGHPLRFVELEVDSLDQLQSVLQVQATAPEDSRIDIVLLDNMGPDRLRQAAQMRDRVCARVELEASGGVTLDSIGEIARTGVDRVSVGSLTHGATWCDLALDVVAPSTGGVHG